MRSILVAVAALFVCTFTHAQTGPAPQNSAIGQSAKASPSADGKPGPGAKPDRAGKIELRDVKSQAGPAPTPLVLKNAGALNTEDAAHSVAMKLAKQDAEKDGRSADLSSTKAQSGTESTAKGAAHSLGREPPEASDAVEEFQPAPSGSGIASSATGIEDGAQSKSPLKRVHGDLYGVAGADGHATGGSAGATSKSGKTSVYVQSDEVRSKAGQPQQ